MKELMKSNKIKDKENAIRKTSNKKLILGIVLDATLSFSVVYPQIYYFLEHLLMNLREIRKNYEEIDISYSVVLLHREAEVLKLSKNSSFSEDEEEVIKLLSDITFYGGSKSGTEDLNKALNLQLMTINRFHDMLWETDKDYSILQQLILITDACAKKSEQFPDYTQNEKNVYGSYSNYGLQQAFIISYKCSYIPKLRIVNANYLLVENEINKCVFGDFEELLNMDEKKTLNAAEGLANEIFNLVI